MAASKSGWSVGALLLGAVVGAVVTAVGAGPTEGSSGDFLRQSREQGQEQLMLLLERKERSLERREATLGAREADLRAAEEQLGTRMSELQTLRDEIRAQLAELDEDREAKVTHLVKMFESVRAPQAATVLAEVDSAIALEVLERMNRGKAGKILVAMPTERAAYLAEQIGGAALSVDVP